MDAAIYAKEAERKEFLVLLFRTVLPLLIQSLFMQSINFIDQLMVSSLGTEAIAAIGSSNKLLSLYNSFLYGSCSGCAMFLAQYWGKGDIKSFRKILGVAMTGCVAMGTVVTVGAELFAKPLLMIFDTNPLVVHQGATYMRVVAPAYFFMGIVFPLNYALRSMNKVKVTMTSTVMSVLINCAVNYILIFGKFGFPKMGVAGAAMGTVVTRVVEMTVLCTYFRVTRNEVFSNIGEMFQFNSVFVKNFFSKAVPLIGNEMMWSLGTTIYFIIYGRSGTDALAAMSIMQTLQMLSKIFIGGFSGASSIIIGNEIGRGDEARVNRFCRRFHVTAVIVGLLSSTLVTAAIPVTQSLYGIGNTEVGEYVRMCMHVLSIYIFLNSCNSINVEGIFRSGGDVKYITVMDMGSIWLVGMPFTVITGLVLKLDIVYVYMAYILLEIYKIPLGYWRFKSGKWLHKLHRIGVENETICYG